MVKKIVIVGATSLIAEHCARIWVERGATELILVGRSQLKLDSIAADLFVRSAGKCNVKALTVSFSHPVDITELANDQCMGALPDIVLIAHGTLPDQVQCQNDIGLVKEALEVNGISPVLFAEAFVKNLVKANSGAVALIGSVAGDRGRQSNYVYGSAKGLVARYVQGLQHRLACSNVKAILIKPGPTATPMTANMTDSQDSMAKVENVARLIVEGLERGQSVIYAPKKWKLIMIIIRHLPNFIFNKMRI